MARKNRIPEGTPREWVNGTLAEQLKAEHGLYLVDIMVHLSARAYDEPMYREATSCGVVDEKGRAVGHLWTLYRAMGKVVAHVREQRKDGTVSFRTDLRQEHEVGERFVLASIVTRAGEPFGASHEDKIFTTREQAEREMKRSQAARRAEYRKLATKRADWKLLDGEV